MVDRGHGHKRREEAVSTHPCPTCKGFCCRDYYLYRIVHMGAEHYQHDCPDCDDGTYGVRSEPEPAPQPVRTAEDERADALAWLRAQAVLPGASPDEKNMLRYAVRALYGGEHVGAANKESP